MLTLWKGGVVKIGRRILSPSSINTYLSCPRKFYLRYIEKLKSKPSIHLLRGSLVHRALQMINKMEGKIDPSEAQALLQRLWSESDASFRALKLPAGVTDQYLEQSKLMVADYVSWLADSPLGKATYVEQRLYARTPSLMGVVDAGHKVDDGVILVDYKTSKKAEITADVWRQAGLYALLWQEWTGHAPREIWIHFLVEANDPKVIQVGQDLIEGANELVKEIHHKTQSLVEADYPCSCGGWCEREFMWK